MERTRVLILELGQVVNVAVNDDVQAVGLVVRCDVAGCESLGHGEDVRRRNEKVAGIRGDETEEGEKKGRQAEDRENRG